MDNMDMETRMAKLETAAAQIQASLDEVARRLQEAVETAQPQVSTFLLLMFVIDSLFLYNNINSELVIEYLVYPFCSSTIRFLLKNY